ncbi:hypothetical protein [Methylogaea oryzae]|uniref:hypothetical protein n=1 Tax=Methylogaea oryzae TaxID=1295382 RepID=UPI000AAF768C|nr:hypothetical protein [Methylogaea oryzae]
MSAANPHPRLLSRAMAAVLAAQFLSALADNALLFAAIALLKSQQRPTGCPPCCRKASSSPSFCWRRSWGLSPTPCPRAG